MKFIFGILTILLAPLFFAIWLIILLYEEISKIGESTIEELIRIQKDERAYQPEVSKKTSCKASRFSDLMVCKKCKLKWDMNDPFPPNCKQGEEE